MILAFLKHCFGENSSLLNVAENPVWIKMSELKETIEVYQDI